MMGKTLRTAWFLLILSLGSAAAYTEQPPVLLQGHNNIVRHSSGDAENPDEHVRESMEQFFRKAQR
ncbi:hypothetical protein [Phytobacter sp. RSE-02]|uniref:hypothetical protein n=1 Tax=Phytobacter sp. RSE-02 TaxID=3229229 RepID=UPI00339D412C